MPPEARNAGARRRTVRWVPAEARACPTMPASALPGRRPSTRRRATGRRIYLARRSTDRSKDAARRHKPDDQTQALRIALALCGLTLELSRAAKRHRLGRIVRHRPTLT